MNPENRSILPPMAFRSFASRYVKPALSEGFQDITDVEFMVGNKLLLLQRECIATYKKISLKERQNNGLSGPSTGFPISQHEFCRPMAFGQVFGQHR